MTEDINQWLQQARSAGLSDDTIVRQLLQSGWVEKDARALVVTSAVSASQTEQPREIWKKRGVVIVLTLAVVILFAGAVYFFFLKQDPNIVATNSSNVNMTNTATSTNVAAIAQISDNQQAFAKDLQTAAKAELLFLHAKSFVSEGGDILSKKKNSYSTQSEWLDAVQEQYTKAATLLQQMATYDETVFTDAEFKARAAKLYKNVGREAIRLNEFKTVYTKQQGNLNISDSLIATAYLPTTLEATIFISEPLEESLRASSYLHLLTNSGYIPAAILQQETIQLYTAAVCLSYHNGKQSVFCPINTYVLGVEPTDITWKSDSLKKENGLITFHFQYPNTYKAFSMTQLLYPNSNTAVSQVLNGTTRDFASTEKCIDVYKQTLRESINNPEKNDGCVTISFFVHSNIFVELSPGNDSGTYSTIELEKFSGFVWEAGDPNDNTLIAYLTPKNTEDSESFEVQILSHVGETSTIKQLFSHILRTLDYSK